MPDKKAIVITVEGGLIQWIAGIPEGVRIVIKDYDVDSVDEEDLTTDENGHEHGESVWEKEDGWKRCQDDFLDPGILYHVLNRPSPGVEARDTTAGPPAKAAARIILTPFLASGAVGSCSAGS